MTVTLSSRQIKLSQHLIDVHTSRQQRPLQSRFRVTSLIEYIQRNGRLGHVLGANNEATDIGLSICAERAAACQLSLLGPGVQVREIYLTSDSPTFLEPGLLCREFLFEYARPSTPVIMLLLNPVPGGERVKITSLGNLYPHPPLYLGMQSSTVPEWIESKNFQNANEWLANEFGGAESTECKLLKSLVSLANSNLSPLHPITYAAGVSFPDGSVLTGVQQKINEYGFSSDPFALCCGASQTLDQGLQPFCLIMCDQFGVLHPPFAVGRSHLLERGWGDGKVVFHTQQGNIKQAHLHELVPNYADVSKGLEQVAKL